MAVATTRLMRKLLQGHLDQRSPGEAAGPVAGADGVERSERRVHQRHIETTFGTVEVERLGYARAGHDSLHPLDAALNLPPERYSLEVRRRVAEAAASRSFDEALFDLSRSTGAEVPKRQAEQLVARAAEDFDAFYEARRAAQGEPPPEGSVVVLTFDGKGVVLHRDTFMPGAAQPSCRLPLDLSRVNDSPRFRHRPYAFDTLPVVHTLRLPAPYLTRSSRAVSVTLTTSALDRGSARRFEASPCRAAPRGLPSSLVRHGCS